jgi:hypothetical protein
MKKILLASLIISTVCISQAEYRINIPLNGVPLKFRGVTSYDPLYGNWVNTGVAHDCSNWSPSVGTVAVGTSFTQTATDCKQEQSRTVQDREIDSGTNAITNVGAPYSENQFITASDTRTSVGTLENWIAATPSYTTWINVGALASCSNWTPDPSTVNLGTSFTQTATNCTQDQSREKQNREQETTTLNYRNVGSPVVETNTLTNQTSTRSSTGTKPTKECIHDNNNPTSWQVFDDYMQQGAATNFGNVIRWKGVVILDNYDFMEQRKIPKITSYVSGGYTYTVGPFVQSSGDSTFEYQLCRE